MPQFKNPFNRKLQQLAPLPMGTNVDERIINGQILTPDGRPSLSNSRASSYISVKEPIEIQLSVVNDSGDYIPPPPEEKRGLWRRTPTSTTTSSHRSMLSENEPFSISRESFESYRRSFDISARSPVIHPDTVSGRQSLDSRLARPPRCSGSYPRSDDSREDSLEEEDAFEDVGLNDDSKPKKRGIFSRFGESSESAEESHRPNSSNRAFRVPGRKRGFSGQGSELGSMPKPVPTES